MAVAVNLCFPLYLPFVCLFLPLLSPVLVSVGQPMKQLNLRIWSQLKTERLVHNTYPKEWWVKKLVVGMPTLPTHPVLHVIKPAFNGKSMVVEVLSSSMQTYIHHLSLSPHLLTEGSPLTAAAVDRDGEDSPSQRPARPTGGGATADGQRERRRGDSNTNTVISIRQTVFITQVCASHALGWCYMYAKPITHVCIIE